MYFQRFFNKRSVAAVATLFLFSACTKIDKTSLGSSLIPPIDSVHTKDTLFNVITSMIPDVDTIFVGKGDMHALGLVNDPVAGTVDAQVNLQLKPKAFPFGFGAVRDSLQLDSIVLGVNWQSTWGRTDQPITVRVREITSENFRFDSLYRNIANFEPYGPELGSAVVSPKDFERVDTLKHYNEVVSNQLRIKLDNSLGNRFLKQFDTLTGGIHVWDTAYKSHTAFDKAFRGFNIHVTGGNAIMNVMLPDAATRLAIYFKHLSKDPTTGAVKIKDTAVSYFEFNSNLSASSNYVKRTLTPAVQQAIANTATPDTIVYMMTSPSGARTEIEIPGLNNLRNVLVHRAELVLDQVPGDATADGYLTPGNLFLSAYSYDSSRIIGIPGGDAEFNIQGIANPLAFGGFPFLNADATTPNTYKYTFNLSRYVQHIVTQKDSSFKLVLTAPYRQVIHPYLNSIAMVSISGLNPYNYPAVGRVALYGGTHSSPRRMRLRIIYSIL